MREKQSMALRNVDNVLEEAFRKLNDLYFDINEIAHKEVASEADKAIIANIKAKASYLTALGAKLDSKVK